MYLGGHRNSDACRDLDPKNRMDYYSLSFSLCSVLELNIVINKQKNSGLLRNSFQKSWFLSLKIDEKGKKLLLKIKHV